MRSIAAAPGIAVKQCAMGVWTLVSRRAPCDTPEVASSVAIRKLEAAHPRGVQTLITGRPALLLVDELVSTAVACNNPKVTPWRQVELEQQLSG